MLHYSYDHNNSKTSSVHIEEGSRFAEEAVKAEQSHNGGPGRTFINQERGEGMMPPKADPLALYIALALGFGLGFILKSLVY
jgi:hypothetical protein